MTTLREAAQQALEAMEKATRFMSDADYRKLNESIDALRAALAEPEDWEVRQLRETLNRCKAVCAATAEAWRMDALAEPTVPSDCTDSHQLGCDRCRSPLWAGTKCDICGRKA